MSNGALIPEGAAPEEDLDGEQRAAVDAGERAIAVLAGPGSGKTRVLSYRARRLLLEDRGSKALLLTFTNKAAAEMKARALGVTAVPTDRVQASTFHTFGLRVLRAHGDLVGIDRDFEVLDKEDQEELAAEAAHAAGVGGRLRRWSYLRLRRDAVREESVAAFGDAYETAKRAAGVVDFDDLIVYTAALLEENPEIAEAYGTQFRHLLVDEFQDTNAAQFAIVEALGAHVQTVSVFADDDQAIYRFVGAEAENIRRFIARLGAGEYPLTFNYRCRDAIVRAANSLIRADPEASGRQMQSVYGGGEVRHLVSRTEEEEAAVIVGEIQDCLADGVPPGDIAVLARASFRAITLLRALEASGVPTSNWLGDSYEPPERHTLATALSIIRSRLNDRQARRLSDFLGVNDSGDREVAAILEVHDGVAGVAELVQLREMAYGDASASAIAHQARACAAVVQPEVAAAMAPIVEAVEGFEAHDPNFTLEHLLAELALGGVGGAPTAGGGVKVASLHRTKGLQWPRVYIVGLEQGTLPDYRAETQTAISEERRACFVGVCRAETHLTLARIREYRGFAKQPSVFLEELGIDPYQ